MNKSRFEELQNTLSLFSLHTPFIPKLIQQQIEKQTLLQSEINKTVSKLGKEKTQQLVIKFKNEAYGQIEPNSDYIINELRNARIKQ